jgi:hypothetical protein
MMIRTFAETFYEGAPGCRTGSGLAGVDKPLLGTRRSRRRLGYASPSLKLSEDTAHIERQDASGVWRRVSMTHNDLQYNSEADAGGEGVLSTYARSRG